MNRTWHSTCVIALLALLELQSNPSSAQELAPKNVIQTENLKTPSRDWQLTRVRVDESRYRSPWIEGYCSRQSVRAGESIDIKVSTKPARSFRIEIFRTGYYDGAGARLMTTIGPLEGKTQPTPTLGEKNLNECQWDTSHRLTIPTDWISGVYLGRLTTIPDSEQEPYWQSYIIFVVTDDRPCEVLFQCSDNTWQAYNQWPSKYSVYTHPKGNQGPWADVSFDRPYGREAQFDSVVNDPLTQGSGEYLPLEFPLAYWLEQQGYDVSYCCNSDMLTADRGLKARSFISVGHDEYWDIRQFRSVEKMRDQGVSLLFLSGNSVCWVSPFRNSFDGRPNRIFFRGGPYGANRPITEARAKVHGPFPERGPDEGFLMGARNVEPVNGGGDWICTMPEHWIFEGTGMKKGEAIPGLIGWEYHGDPADIPGLSIVGSGTAWVSGQTPQTWTATVYEGPNGNVIFNASSIFWVQGLSDPPGHTLPWSHWSRPHGPDPRVQRITKNVLDRALGKSANK
ncbi:MAG: N,N-dimethylformamidase beta subunit family domain-containing protein [Pirellula sp.]